MLTLSPPPVSALGVSRVAPFLLTEHSTSLVLSVTPRFEETAP
jgi:hypothetical protein